MNPRGPQYSTVSRLALRRHEDRRGLLPVRGGDDADPADPVVVVHLAAGADLLRGGHRPVDPLVVGIGDLPPALGLDAVVGPGPQDHVDLLLEDLPVDPVVFEPGLGLLLRPGGHLVRGQTGRGERGLAAEVLAHDVRPAGLVAAGEADEEPPVGQVVEDGRLLGHPDRVLGAHHVAELADADVLGDGRPVGVEDAGGRPDLVALGVEVVLDGGHAPEAEAVGGPHDVVPVLQRLVVPLDVAADRAELLAFGPGPGDDWIDLENRLHHHRLLALVGCPTGRG